MSKNAIELSGPASAAAITAAAALIDGVMSRSPSRVPSKETSNQFATRIGELARIILDSLEREPVSIVEAEPVRTAPQPPAAAEVEAVPKHSVGW
jgi:hypothetical protein